MSLLRRRRLPLRSLLSLYRKLGTEQVRPQRMYIEVERAGLGPADWCISRRRFSTDIVMEPASTSDRGLLPVGFHPFPDNVRCALGTRLRDLSGELE